MDGGPHRAGTIGGSRVRDSHRAQASGAVPAEAIHEDPRTPAAPSPPPRSLARRMTHVMVAAATIAIVAAASIAFSLQVTPLQEVSALGQTVGVGAAAPTASFSGPGELELFGQSLPTNIRFAGPVRPRLVLTDITINDQVAGLFDPEKRGGTAQLLGDALARGWKRYFGWEIAFVGIGAVLLLGVIAGWRRHAWTWRRTVLTVAGGLVLVEAVNLGVIMLTAYTAPGILEQVRSLDALVGRDDEASLVPADPGPPLRGVRAVVIGDSTAAGVGNGPLADPTRLDEACGRSNDAYAVHLADVNRWDVRNLACGSATIDDGVLGPQIVGGRTIPAQLAVAKRAVDASAIVLSVGANDMDWGSMIRLCAVSETCDDRASTAYFQRRLASFSSDYYRLLRQLGSLPSDAQVLINLYYAPFEPDADCLPGLSGPKIASMLGRLDALNAVLAQGAETFGYDAVRPDFTGHGLCSDDPYVQGLEDPVPFHPNATGELVIALADEQALLGVPPSRG
jgi:lysophospholipase L1-like esterase